MIDLRLGDCVEKTRGIPDASIDAIIADPPYGINFRHADGASGRTEKTVKWAKIAGDMKPDGRWLEGAYRVLRDSGVIYVMTRWDVEPEWRALLKEYGFRLKQRLIWHKRTHGKGDVKTTYAPSVEDVLYAVKGRHILNRRPSMLLDVGCVPTWEHRYHPHQKPVALPAILIETSTKDGDTVLDPFMGSGTTGVACLNTDRNFIGIESDPAYFTVAERRIAAEIAKHPLLPAVTSFGQ